MLVLKRQCLSKRRPQIPKYREKHNLAHQAELMSVTNRPFQNPDSLWLSLIDTTTSLWLSPMRQLFSWVTWHKWCNVTYRYVLQCHNVTVSQIAVSKSQNILNEGRCSIVRGVERKGSPSQNFWHRLQRRLDSHSLQKELVQIWCQRRSMAAISYLQMIPNLCNITGGDQGDRDKKGSFLTTRKSSNYSCPGFGEFSAACCTFEITRSSEMNVAFSITRSSRLIY